MIVDIHTHYVPESLLSVLKDGSKNYKLGAEIVNDNNVEVIKFKQGMSFPMTKELYCLETRLHDMDKRLIDIDVLSASPTVYFYETDAASGKFISRMINESIAAAAKNNPRFLGLGTLPLQSVKDSVSELEFLVENLGIKGVQIGTNVKGKGIWDADFLPLYEVANKYELFIFIHPMFLGDSAFLENYYLVNLIGQPLNTTIAISYLIFSGVLDKFPKIKWGLAHGGGYLPFGLGRLEHGFEVRAEAKVNIKRPPSYYMDKIYCDTITHNVPALKYAIETFGYSNVFLGSDYPYDMADFNPVKTIKDTAGVNADYKKKILGENALRVLHKA